MNPFASFDIEDEHAKHLLELWNTKSHWASVFEFITTHRFPSSRKVSSIKEYLSEFNDVDDEANWKKKYLKVRVQRARDSKLRPSTNLQLEALKKERQSLFEEMNKNERELAGLRYRYKILLQNERNTELLRLQCVYINQLEQQIGNLLREEEKPGRLFTPDAISRTPSASLLATILNISDEIVKFFDGIKADSCGLGLAQLFSNYSSKEIHEALGQALGKASCNPFQSMDATSSGGDTDCPLLSAQLVALELALILKEYERGESDLKTSIDAMNHVRALIKNNEAIRKGGPEPDPGEIVVTKEHLRTEIVKIWSARSRVISLLVDVDKANLFKEEKMAALLEGIRGLIEDLRQIVLSLNNQRKSEILTTLPSTRIVASQHFQQADLLDLAVKYCLKANPTVEFSGLQEKTNEMTALLKEFMDLTSNKVDSIKEDFNGREALILTECQSIEVFHAPGSQKVIRSMLD